MLPKFDSREERKAFFQERQRSQRSMLPPSGQFMPFRQWGPANGYPTPFQAPIQPFSSLGSVPQSLFPSLGHSFSAGHDSHVYAGYGNIAHNSIPQSLLPYPAVAGVHFPPNVLGIEVERLRTIQSLNQAVQGITNPGSSYSPQRPWQHPPPLQYVPSPNHQFSSRKPNRHPATPSHLSQSEVPFAADRMDTKNPDRFLPASIEALAEIQRKSANILSFVPGPEPPRFVDSKCPQNFNWEPRASEKIGLGVMHSSKGFSTPTKRPKAPSSPRKDTAAAGSGC